MHSNTPILTRTISNGITSGIAIAALLSITAPLAHAADNGGMKMDHHMQMQHHGGMASAIDTRTSLGLNEMQRNNQKAMMRDHLKAVNEIVALIADEEFDKASDIAHKRLGLTPEMQQMCDMFANVEFQKLGIEFHQSADDLGEVLKTGNTANSLKALNRTMNYCISCHQSFRQ